MANLKGLEEGCGALYALLRYTTYSDDPDVLEVSEDSMFLFNKAEDLNGWSDNFEHHIVMNYEEYLERNMEDFNPEEAEYFEYKVVDEYDLYHLTGMPAREKKRCKTF